MDMLTFFAFPFTAPLEIVDQTHQGTNPDQAFGNDQTQRISAPGMSCQTGTVVFLFRTAFP
jgi:hypothetical protein